MEAWEEDSLRRRIAQLARTVEELSHPDESAGQGNKTVERLREVDRQIARIHLRLEGIESFMHEAYARIDWGDK